MKNFLQFSVLIGFCLALFLAGCGKEPAPRQQASTLDTPSHHVLRGKDMIRNENWSQARREFQLALELDGRYSPALAGMALVWAYESSLTGKTKQQKEEAQADAKNYLNRALDAVKDDKEKANAHTIGIRVWTFLNTDDALGKAESHFQDASGLYQENFELEQFRAEPYFYMAGAYKQALEIQKASDNYREVLNINRGFVRDAREELELLDKILRAQPGSRHGKAISLIPAINRADMAALLIEELELASLFKRNTAPTYDNSFQAPGAETPQKKSDRNEATDISTHPLRSDIEEVLKIGVRGLEVDPRGLYYPDKKITRAEFALMLEDILIQVTQENSLSTKFIGESSPWGDVREDAFYYNAARTLVSRSIMDVFNKARGEFGPDKSVHGADALLSIRVLKDELQSYVRSPES